MNKQHLKKERKNAIGMSIKRFIEVTIPMIIFQGLLVWVVTAFVNKWFGLFCIFLYALVDVLLTDKGIMRYIVFVRRRVDK